MASLKRAHLIPILGPALFAASCSAPPPPQAPEESAQAENVVAAPEETPSPNPPVAGAPELLAPSVNTNESEPKGPRDARSKEEIQRVMADNRQKVRACYEAALQKNPGIKGDLVVGFVIDPDGDVKEAEVNWSESDLHVPELDTCAVEAIRTFKFPASSRGLESKVNYPFNFNPQPPDKPAAKP